MSLFEMEDEASDPPEVGFLGAVGVVPGPQKLRHPLQKFRSLARCRRGLLFLRRYLIRGTKVSHPEDLGLGPEDLGSLDFQGRGGGRSI